MEPSQDACASRKEMSFFSRIRMKVSLAMPCSQSRENALVIQPGKRGSAFLNAVVGSHLSLCSSKFLSQ